MNADEWTFKCARELHEQWPRVDHADLEHLAAKREQGRWLKGYHVTIAQVLNSYGDAGIAHPLAKSDRAPLKGHERDPPSH
jgi:hypothetical protein